MVSLRNKVTAEAWTGRDGSKELRQVGAILAGERPVVLSLLAGEELRSIKSNDDCKVAEATARIDVEHGSKRTCSGACSTRDACAAAGGGSRRVRGARARVRECAQEQEYAQQERCNQTALRAGEERSNETALRARVSREEAKWSFSAPGR